MKHMLHKSQFDATYEVRSPIFDAFSSREPVSTSLENALAIVSRGSLCCDDIDAETSSHAALALVA
jgi:hypothetical protein